jgi:cytochrome P450
MTTTEHPPTFAASDLATPAIIANPYPAYAALRPHSPIPGYVDYPPGTVPGVDEPVTAWALLKHEHVRNAARDHETFSSRDPLQEASDAPTLMLVNTDQPLHSAHRKVVNTVFTRSRVEAMRPWLTQRVAQLVAGLPDGEEFDAVSDLCAHVPAVVMCKFFGAPDTDAPRYERWANAFMLSADLTGEERNASNQELGAYFVTLCQNRAEALAGGEAPGDGLIDALIVAEADGQKLDLPEIVRFCITLVVAGSETSMYFGANVIDALLDHPAAAVRVRADRSLIKPFLEETLRLTGPPQRLFRIATRDVQIGDAQIKTGDWVALFFAAANHDPDIFPEPELFDLDRTNANKHLTYGLGIHYCLGAPLATLEIEVLVGALFDRFARIQRGAADPVPQTATLLQHSRSRIPVVLHENES